MFFRLWTMLRTMMMKKFCVCVCGVWPEVLKCASLAWVICSVLMHSASQWTHIAFQTRLYTWEWCFILLHVMFFKLRYILCAACFSWHCNEIPCILPVIRTLGSVNVPQAAAHIVCSVLLLTLQRESVHIACHMHIRAIVIWNREA